jgi:hypothetical protein
MIAAAGYFRMNGREESSLAMNPQATLPMGETGFTGG